MNVTSFKFAVADWSKNCFFLTNHHPGIYAIVDFFEVFEKTIKFETPCTFWVKKQRIHTNSSKSENDIFFF